jgi:hypothetical protein
MAKKNTTTTTGKTTGSKPTPPAPPPPPKPAPAKSPQTGSGSGKGTKGKAQTTNPAPAKSPQTGNTGSKGTKGKAQTTNPVPVNGKTGFTPTPQGAGTTTANKIQGGETKGADAKGSGSKPAFVPSKPTAKSGWNSRPTPIDVQPRLDEMNNPMLGDIKRRFKEQPDIMKGALRSSKSPEEAFNKVFAEWGRDPEMEADALASLERIGLLKYFGDDDEPLDASDALALYHAGEHNVPDLPYALYGLLSYRQRNLNYVSTSEHVRDSVQSEADEIAELMTCSDLFTNPAQLERALEIAFGYSDIRSANESLTIDSYLNLTTANLAILDYIETVAPQADALEIFDTYVSEHGAIGVVLGAEYETSDVTAATGLAPLTISSPSSYIIYLGSDVTVGTIVHESVHEIDRAFERRYGVPLSTAIANGTVNINGVTFPTFVNATGIPPTAESIYGAGDATGSVIQGYVGQGSSYGDFREIFPDLVMTLLLAGLGESVFVNTSTTNTPQYQLFPVAWEIEEDGSRTEQSLSVEAFLNMLLEVVLQS